MTEAKRNCDGSRHLHTRDDDGGRSAAPGASKLAPLILPVSWVRLIGMGLLAALFVAIGLFFCLSPEWRNKIIGLVCVLFFGGGYGAVLWKKLRDPVVLTLSEDGIQPHSGGFIPWEDFEAVGIGRIEGAPGGTKVIGIRLKSYEGYLASFTPEQIRLARATAVAGKFTGSVLRRAAPRPALRHGRGGLQALAALPQRDIAGMLQWSRAMSGGWDVTFSPHLFKGRARDVVRKIEGYYLSALTARSAR
ncbi:STM3941 family protein [Arthrobacter sp. zg-Y1219]|uniref:STM3941 family protein n=1 Tax=Arthrobacter sp. zg-Y1219 TaxID=3049067 RepID=UPI0024C44841|nr:STM3941 family protein [Arthrobacter sp. zg-Y1219]MDK1359269.1 STM3941 family protein [Arthrobacter sp. zg-Y1219]